MWLDAWVGGGRGVVSPTPPAVGLVSRVAERPHRLCERGVRAACHRRSLEKSNTSVIPASRRRARVPVGPPDRFAHRRTLYAEGATFPGICPAGALTRGQAILEFILFAELASCSSIAIRRGPCHERQAPRSP